MRLLRRGTIGSRLTIGLMPAATHEIARNVEQAAAGTQEVSTNIVTVTHAANDTGTAATQIRGASNQLSEQSASLKAEVERFLSTIRAS